jgi:hypothetical protein
MTTTNGRLSHAELSEADEVAALGAKFEKVLRDARTRGAAAPMATEESISAGNATMKLGRENAAKTLLTRITSHVLVTEDDLAARLHVNREWIVSALGDHRLFSFLGPDEVRYFPAFYGDSTLHRGALKAVCSKLGNLPGASKYHFFTSKSTFLRTQTPLEALRDGLLTKVLIAAEGFAIR